nr:hypothetical protein [Tanacetum cinerariifolium]
SNSPIQMVNTRTDAELSAAVQNALQTLLPQIRAKIREEFRTGDSSRGRGELDFVHGKIFDVMGCKDAFKTRLAVYKFEGNALAWWKAYKQKSGDRHQPTTQQSSHRNHSHNNDRHGSDRRGSGDNHRSNNNYSGNNNRHPGGCHRAAGTCFKCGQTVHLQKDCKKNTAASTSSQADKKPRAS